MDRRDLPDQPFSDDRARDVLESAGSDGSLASVRAVGDRHSAGDWPERIAAEKTGGVMRRLRNIYNLGIKELRSLLGDKAMLTLIVFAFTISVYSSATVLPGSLHLAPIAIADMDQSQLSNRIVNSFYRPWFLPPEMITADEMDAGLDAGRYT